MPLTVQENKESVNELWLHLLTERLINVKETDNKQTDKDLNGETVTSRSSASRALEWMTAVRKSGCNGTRVDPRQERGSTYYTG